MPSFEDQLLLDAQLDANEVEYIRQRIAESGLQDDGIEDDDIYYLIDLLPAYYAESGILDAQPDAEGCIDIPVDAIVEYVQKTAQREIGKTFPTDLLALVVEADLDFSEMEE